MTIRSEWKAASTPHKAKAVGEVLVALIAIGGFVLGILSYQSTTDAAQSEAASDAGQISWTAKYEPGEDPGVPVFFEIRNGSRRSIRDVTVITDGPDAIENLVLSLGSLNGCRTYKYQFGLYPMEELSKGIRASVEWRDATGTYWQMNNDPLDIAISNDARLDVTGRKKASVSYRQTEPYSKGECK